LTLDDTEAAETSPLLANTETDDSNFTKNGHKERLVVGASNRVQTLSDAARQACKAFNKKKALVSDLRRVLKMVPAASVKAFGGELPTDISELNFDEIRMLIKALRVPSEQKMIFP
jgi:hypothetical protein